MTRVSFRTGGPGTDQASLPLWPQGRQRILARSLGATAVPAGSDVGEEGSGSGAGKPWHSIRLGGCPVGRENPEWPPLESKRLREDALCQTLPMAAAGMPADARPRCSHPENPTFRVTAEPDPGMHRSVAVSPPQRPVVDAHGTWVLSGSLGWKEEASRSWQQNAKGLVLPTDASSVCAGATLEERGRCGANLACSPRRARRSPCPIPAPVTASHPSLPSAPSVPPTFPYTPSPHTKLPACLPIEKHPIPLRSTP